MELWKPDAVAGWLRGLGLNEYADEFAEENVDGTILMQLDDEMLAELGVDDIGDREKILRGVQQQLDAQSADDPGGGAGAAASPGALASRIHDVEFGEGPLGLQLRSGPGPTGCSISYILEEGQADRAGLQRGAMLVKMDGGACAQWSYKDIVAQVKAAGRPLRLSFELPHAVGSAGHAASAFMGRIKPEAAGGATILGGKRDKVRPRRRPSAPRPLGAAAPHALPLALSAALHRAPAPALVRPVRERQPTGAPPRPRALAAPSPRPRCALAAPAANPTHRC